MLAQMHAFSADAAARTASISTAAKRATFSAVVVRTASISAWRSFRLQAIVRLRESAASFLTRN